MLGGFIALTGALAYAELGGLPAFLYGWTIILVIAPGALALVAAYFAANVRRCFPELPAKSETWIALCVILSLTVVNIRGVRWGSIVQNVFTVSKLAALALLAIGGLLYFGDPLPPLPGMTIPEPTHHGPLAILAAMMPVLFSYGGWQNGTYIAAEVRRPRRGVPFAIIGGTLVVIVCSLVINLAYLRVLTPDAIAGSRTFASRAAEVALGPIGGFIVTAGILVSTFGICAAILLTNPRGAQAVGQDGLFFAAFGRLHPVFRTPHWAITVLGAWSCALLLIGRAGELLDAVVFADWLFFALTAATLFVFRRKLPSANRPYRCHLYPWFPAAFLLLAILMAGVTFMKSGLTSRLLGPGILALGVPVYYAFRAHSRTDQST